MASGNFIPIFTPEEVDDAVRDGLLSMENRDNIIQLVDKAGSNDIILIPAGGAPGSDKRNLLDWTLTNNRC